MGRMPIVSTKSEDKTLHQGKPHSSNLTFRELGRRIKRALRRSKKQVAEGESFLPLLIKVLAGFAKLDGQVQEVEIDSTLGFLRYDYPEAVYSELRALYLKALREEQNLGQVAEKLARQLSPERKILLGVQLYDLISKVGMEQKPIAAFYAFMSQLGMSSQAVEIVNQLNASLEIFDASTGSETTGPFESLCIGGATTADVKLEELGETERLLAFRYHNLILLKNLCLQQVMVRGRAFAQGQFRRLYPGDRVVLKEQVISHQDFIYYFNAKKNILLPEVYVHLWHEREVRLEKHLSRDSAFGIIFGLHVNIRTLKDTGAILNGIVLKKGTQLQAGLHDTMIFGNGSELSLAELRRRTRDLGSRLKLTSSKSEYLVSNNPTLLKEGDILLSPGTTGEVLLRIQCDYEHRAGRLEVLRSERPILLGRVPVKSSALLIDGDLIQINDSQALRCNFTERIIEEERNIIHSLELHDITCFFGRSQVALDNISFSANRGEMLCVLGPSGSGKSSLLRCIAGCFAPRQGQVFFNKLSLYENLTPLSHYIAHVPHEDSFDEFLTVRENVNFAAAIRAPHLSKTERELRVDAKLVELGLQDRKHSVVGKSTHKILSGGERKRLNIGLDMIGSADVYLLDEPTSGLSSKDSEHVLEILRNLSQNKIVIVTIHQPSSKIFHMFDKALLLDQGGRLVFFGTPDEMLEYFSQTESIQELSARLGKYPLPPETMQPEYIFDVLESPLRDLGGEILYEEDDEGQRIPSRRFSPEYWRNKYESHRLLKEVSQLSMEKEILKAPIPSTSKKPLHRCLRDEWVQFWAMLGRAFISRMRNRTNLMTTLVEAPLLALLIATVLRYSEESDYDFSSAFHIPIYLFLTLVVAMFLGLTNSADDIIRDRPILDRERNLNLRLSSYLTAKVLTLALFAIIQCILFILIGNSILQVRGMFWEYLLFMGMTSLSGIAFGLFISSLAPDAKTAANVVPLILIPQIILGGALIKYEEMNQNFDFIYKIERFLSEKRQPGQPLRVRSDLEVPTVCEFIPMRWSYEALVVAQSKQNPLTASQEKIQQELSLLAEKETLSTLEEERLEVLKELLAYLHGLRGRSYRQILRTIKQVMTLQEAGNLQALAMLKRNVNAPYSAEQLFVNKKVSDLVSKAEIEQADYRGQRPLNVFFGPAKYYFNQELSVFLVNSIVLNSLSLFVFLALYWVLSQRRAP